MHRYISILLLLLFFLLFKNQITPQIIHSFISSSQCKLLFSSWHRISKLCILCVYTLEVMIVNYSFSKSLNNNINNLILVFIMYSLQLFIYFSPLFPVHCLKMFVVALFLVKNYHSPFPLCSFISFICLFISLLFSSFFSPSLRINKKCICRDSNPDLHLGRVEFCP